MAIQGKMGESVGDSRSATYSSTQRDRFIGDAIELGFNVIVTTHIRAIDLDGKVTGEWLSDGGGMLAWSA